MIHTLHTSSGVRPALFATALFCLIIAPGRAQEQPEVFNPEALYAPQLEGGKNDTDPKTKAAPAPGKAQTLLKGEVRASVKDGGPVRRSIPLKPESTIGRIVAWAMDPTKGPKGRPLPLAGSWNAEDWGPKYFQQLIEGGHHVILNFNDPSSEGMRAYFSGEKGRPRMMEAFETYYRPGLEFAKANKLPICFRGWNWAEGPVDFQERPAKLNKTTIPLEKMAALVVNGERAKGRTTDPFGPIENWVEWGKFWFGNELIKMIQDVYPDPPMVVFLNNNEAGEPHVSGDLDKSDRFRAKFGDGPHDPAFVDKVIREAFDEKYAAMFAAAKASLASPTWRKNARFVAYNTLWGTTSIGYGKNPRPGMGFDNAKGWLQWRRYDGDMTEFYSNDWQGGKSEVRPFSMQVEAGNMASVQDRILGENPEFLLSHIYWDGGVPGNIFRGRRATSKTFAYIANGSPWGFDRYEGWVQFCLWTARSRLAFEFRGQEKLDALKRGVWMALLNSVDRPWNDPILEEFWRHGKLVPNRDELPAFNGLTDEDPEWVRKLDRWSMLTNDANPPRESWDDRNTRLNVYALAYVLGEAPKRRWLIYAHAPAGARTDVKVVIPEYGVVQLASVPQSGSFFLLDEADNSLTTVMAGGPDEIQLAFDPVDPAKKSGKWVAAEAPIAFTATVAHAPDRAFKEFTWDFGDGKAERQRTLSPVTHSYAKPGIYYVTVQGMDGAGKPLSRQVAVQVGTEPDPEVVYDLSLDRALAFEGPWAGDGENGQTLVTYRQIPNAGSNPSAVAADVKFVDDPQRGRVMELDSTHGGVWFARNAKTTLTGEKGIGNRTISFWFKAKEIGGRQMLYASGLGACGMNIYLAEGTLYAGSWAVVDGKYDAPPPQYGYNWKGDWMTYGPVEAGKWVHVTWVVKDGQNKVEPDRQRLYIDGKLVAKAPGASIPAEYMPPRLGRGADSDDLINPLTRFHDQDAINALKANKRPSVKNFRGYLSDFKFINAAREP